MGDTSTTGLMDRELIEAGLRSAQAWLPSSDNPRFVQGAIAAYRWLLGAAVAPVSGDPVPASAEAIRREENLADDVVYGGVFGGAFDTGGPPADARYAVGAQNALLWARGADPHPPISIG
jgi:hypothetical protein